MIFFGVQIAGIVIDTQREWNQITYLAPHLPGTVSALVNATKLRDLDAFEELFWLVEQSVNVSHAVVVEVKGSTTIGQ
jgi:hypothetical protein